MSPQTHQTQNIQIQNIQPRPSPQQIQNNNIQQQQQLVTNNQLIQQQPQQQQQQQKVYSQQYVTQLIRNTTTTPTTQQQQQQPSPVQNQFQQIQATQQQMKIQTQPTIQQFNPKQIIQTKSIHSTSSTPSPSSSVQASNSSNNQTVNNHIINKTVTRIDNDDDDLIGDVTTMVGIDLEAEKKSLLGVATKSANLEQIRSCKDEKFLNINVLHKKFEEIGKVCSRGSKSGKEF
jgi:hypothetical protein